MKFRGIKEFFVLFMFLNFQFLAQDSLKLEYILTGDYSGDGFGVVVYLGDIDSDGYDDFAIGAPDSNYVKIYFGGDSFDSLNYLKIKNDISDSLDYSSAFGFSIAGNGDLNGDDINDFVVSNPYYGSSKSGALYVYLGKTKLNITHDYKILGTRLSSEFGYSVSMSGDINGDGYDDILVGAPFYFSGFYIYFGDDSISTSPNIIIEDQLNEEFLGISVDIIGDLNNDSNDDFLVGKPYSFQTDTSRAYLFYGGNFSTIGFENAVVFNDRKENHFASKVAGLSDINNDGFSDFAIMGKYSVQIYCGNKNNIYENPIIINEVANKGHFTAIESIGDLNKDGYSDFIIGCENPSGDYSGLIDVYFGSEDTLELFTTILGDTPNSYFGSYVSNIGNITGDSVQYIAIGEKRYPTGSPDENYLKVKIYTFTITTDTKNPPIIIGNYELCQNYPNPFNPSTTIEYSISKSGFVQLIVYDVLGQVVTTLVNEHQTIGKYSVQFNASSTVGGLPSGFYFYKIVADSYGESGGFSEVSKMLLLK